MTTVIIILESLAIIVLYLLYRSEARKVKWLADLSNGNGDKAEEAKMEINHLKVRIKQLNTHVETQKVEITRLNDLIDNWKKVAKLINE